MNASLKRIFRTLIGLSLAVLPFAIIIWQHQNIEDWIKLRGYHPPAAISTLASQDTMTNYARRLFYINQPALVSDRSTFASDCSVTEQTIVLGCYHSGESGIFLFSVKDPSLSGVEQVTAAHETLHAAYDRLSASDKKYVDGLLTSYYQHGLHDKRILATIQAYKKTEPNDVVNEMHSVFGTEVANLPAPLENYYKRYFTNRAKVVAYSAKYEAKFTNLSDQIDADDQQLATLKQTITADQQSLAVSLAQIQADRARLDQLRSSGQIAAYNAAVPGFNAEVDAYNSRIAQVQSLISQYNALVKIRNALAVNLGSLSAEIDTRLTAQSTK